MKKLLFLFLFILASASAKSQVLISLVFGDKLNSDKIEFGLDGGLNMASLSGVDPSSSANNFNLGFYFDLKLKNPSWMVHTGVIVKSTMGAKELAVYSLNDEDLDNSFAEGSVERRLGYFNVPILMKYKFSDKFFAEGGPMLGLMAKSKDVFTKEISDKEDLSYERKIRDLYHPLDAGLMFGMGYRLMGGNGMNLGIRYYEGLVDVEIDDKGADVRNRSLYFTVGIPIGKGKLDQN
ncbi:MAG: porin family protein [Algoriphagus sp.]|nr:porin family protein [Algoriphagus sp.]